MARVLLESGGFRVTEAVDASQAMQLMGTGEEFALMVTDLMMPALPTPTLAPQRAPSLRATTAMPVMNILPPAPRQSGPTPMPMLATGTDGAAQQGVDWARFAATVQSSIRRTEH